MNILSGKMLVIVVAVLWVGALGSAAGAIYCKHRAREMFVELEQSAWSTQAFVERVATTKLHMAMPPPKEIEIVAP